METILAATDFSQPATNAVQYAAELCKQLKVRYLVLYHAYKLLPVSRETPESMILSQEKMQECMELFLSELRESLLSIAPEDTLILTKADSRPLETGLANLVETCEAKLVVIGSERDVLKKLLVGSNTKKLMKATHVPILVIPPRAQFKPIRKIVMGCDLKTWQTLYRSPN
jgi:nucleotide-binding universal stress UspA family protein